MVTCRTMAEEEVDCGCGLCGRKERRSSCMDDGNEESPSDMDGSESPDLDDEWRNWRLDAPELVSDDSVEEGVNQKRRRSVGWP